MTIHELARIVRSMRKSQNDYFAARTPQALNQARDWERRVDAACKEVLSPPEPSLYQEKQP